MLSKFLPGFQENADLGVQEAVPLLEARSLDFEGIQTLCTDFRRRGLCALFRGSTPEVLLEDLQRSGAAFAFFLGSFDERRAKAASAAAAAAGQLIAEQHSAEADRKLADQIIAEI